MKRSTLELIVNAFNTASSDETRITMTGVRLMAREAGKLHIVATDGHILSEHVADDVIEGLTAEGLTIPNESLAAIKHVLKTDKHAPEFTMTATEHRVTLGGPSGSVEIGCIGREYPKYETVIPVKFRKSLKIHLNAQYLMDITKALAGGRDKHTKDFVTLELDASDDTCVTPIKVTVGDLSDRLGVLMPRRK